MTRRTAGAGGRAPAHTRTGLTFLGPFALGVLVLLLVPALLNLRYAFTDYTGLTPSVRFNGLANLRRLMADPLFAASLRASLVHAAIAVPLRMLVATGAGLLLAAPRRGGRWYRTAVFLPTVVPDVALALLFLWLLNPVFGPINQLLGTLGFPEPVWLADPWGARLGIVLMMLFPIGEAFLVVLAARRAVDPDLYAAAAVDGASAFQQLWTITLPLLAPLLVLLTIRDVILTLQVNFVPAYILTDGRPANATLYLPVYIYDHAFEFAGFGYAAMMTLVLLAITTALVTLVVVLARRWRLL